MQINLTVDNENIEEDFLRIATDLMNNWILQVENSHYRITEIEFYYNSIKHDDKFTHKHDLQKENARWYFHGSGVDLTFGSNEYYGGILLRAISGINTNKKEYTCGPLNIITQLFSNLSSIYSSTITFGLIRDVNKKIEYEKPIAAPRVGLNSKSDPDMINKNYRFLVMPKSKHAEKEKIAIAMKQQGYSELEIKNIWG